jgi:TPR repeat protein
MLWPLLAASAVLFTLAGAAAAGPYEDGLAAAKRGDHATALILWRPLAQQGDAQAQSGLGTMYANGVGVAQDYAEAAKW